MEGFPLKRLGEVREAFERTHFNRRWKASNMVSWCVPYKTLSVLVGPIWSSPSLFELYQDKKIHTQKSRKNGVQYATKSKTYKGHAHHYIV